MFEALGVRTPVSDSFIDLSTGLHMPEEVLDSRLLEITIYIGG